MADVFKVIFELEANGQGVLKEIDAVAKKYGQVNAEIKKQEDELNKLLKQEQDILKLRAKSTSPSTAAQQTEALKKVQAQITGTKNELTKLAAVEKEVGNETKKLNETVKKGLDGTKQLGLRQQLKALKLELAGATDPKEVERLAIAVGELQDKFDAAAESARIFTAGDRLEQFGIAIQDVGSKVLSLDFSGALDQSRLLLRVSEQMTFKDALNGIADLGQTLFNVGKALIKNPLFLIGAVATAIIANFNDLKKSGGALGATFRFIDDVITGAKRAFDDLTDSIGATNNALERVLKNEARVISIANDLTQQALNTQIAIRAAAGRNTDKLEQERLKAQADYAQLEINNIINTNKLKGIEQKKFSQEDKDRIKELSKTIVEAETARGASIVRAYTDARNKIRDLNKQVGTEADKSRAFDVEFKLKPLSKEQIQKNFQLQRNEIARQRQEEINAAALEFENEARKGEIIAKIKQKYGLQYTLLKKQEVKAIIDAQKEAEQIEINQLKAQQEAKASIINGAIEARKSQDEKFLEQYSASVVDESLLESQKTQIKLDINRKYYEDIISAAQAQLSQEKELSKKNEENLIADIARRKEAKLDTTVQERELAQLQLDNNTKIAESERELANKKIEYQTEVAVTTREINEQILQESQNFIDSREEREKTRLTLARARQSTIIKSELDFERERLQLLKDAGKEYTEEYRDQLDKVALLEREHQKQQILEYTSYFEQVVTAAVSATNQILDAKIKEVDKQTELQQKRVDEAKAVAESGNAELLEEEKKRLENLNKEKEKFVRQQQALATVELVANTAIAVSKAAAEGGVAAGITIAAALLALVAGLASARSIAGQAAYYDGGLFEEGFTGHGNPRDESGAVGRKPYIYHREEFIFNHKNTRKFRDIFEGVHEGRIDLREWQRKAKEYDSFNFGRSLNAMNPIINNSLEIDELRGQLDKLINVVQNQKTSVSLDEHGFSMHINKVIDRSNFIKNLAK